MPAEVDFDDVLQMQVPDLDGAKLSDIRTGSPAYNAGIRRGDIIRSWDGIEIKEFKDLYRVAEKAEPNSRVLVTLIRDGQERSTEVVVGTLPDFDSEGGIRLEKVRGLYGREP
jgi:S1-C subfamily serine protease